MCAFNCFSQLLKHKAWACKQKQQKKIQSIDDLVDDRMHGA